MYAKNPKTGENIRIITSEASAWRDQKTVVWLDSVPQDHGSKDPATWNRWEVAATSIAAAKQLAAAGIKPEVVLCLDDYDTTSKWLEQGNASSAVFIAVPRGLVTHIGFERLMEFKVTNLVCLEELKEIYPYTGPVWDGTLEDAKLLLSLMLRAGRAFPITSANDARAAVAKSVGLAISDTVPSGGPPPLWFITQYFVPDKAKRRREIRACLEANLDCPYIDKVVLLNEEEASLPSHPKMEQHVIGKRVSYGDILRWVCDHAPEDAIVAFANADIFADSDSWRLLWSVNLETPARFFALLRWDVEGTDKAAQGAAKLFGPRNDSQDTWIVSAAAVKRAFAAPIDWVPFDIPLGKAGCDNAITIEMLRKKFEVVNPCINLKTFHYHSSQVRTYDPREIVSKPAYLYIQPTGLQDMRPVTQIQDTPTLFKGSPFDRPVRGPLTAAQAATFCAMVARSTQGAIQLSATEKNSWTPPVVPLYTFTNAFQSREGLAFNYSSIFLGKTKACAEAWTKCQLSSLSASISSEVSIAAPLPDEVAEDTGKYVLQYLAKVILLRQKFKVPDAEFWASKKGGAAEVLPFFDWSMPTYPILSRDEVRQAWSEKMVTWLPQDGPAELCTREEIGALRSAFSLGGGWEEAPAKKRIVFIIDDTWLTDKAASDTESRLEGIDCSYIWTGRTTTETALRTLRGAWGVVLFSRDLVPWMWTLPRKSFVWDIQSEMRPNAELLHMAGAAELEHRLCIVPKGSPTAADVASLVEKIAGSVLEEMGACIQKEEAERKFRERPALLMPAGATGLFAHAGDSFREMARMWAEKGHVELVETEAVSQIWLGEKGRVLLYDRPTYEWLKMAPADEKKWKLALFGNPAPPESVNGMATKPWIFWPRRPRLVEDIVARKPSPVNRSFSERAQKLVFYGRSENAVQRGRRTKADWSKVCSEFVHVDGEKPYPFTQEEYLEKLTDAKFGLCLAGYGNKCHREIECMAMGCVPIVAPEVDMESYANPPRLGLHYYRASSPAEAAAIIAATSEQQWTIMSGACKVWWKHNVSVDGSWATTKKLLEV